MAIVIKEIQVKTKVEKTTCSPEMVWGELLEKLRNELWQEVDRQEDRRMARKRKPER